MGATKRAKQFFKKHTNSARKKGLVKKLRKKVRKTFFLYSHKYRYQKMGGKTRETIFQKHKNSAIKKCWEKNRRKKVRKTFFYIHTNIVTKKWGQQNARNNFSRNTLIARAKNLGKKVGKK